MSTTNIDRRLGEAAALQRELREAGESAGLAYPIFRTLGLIVDGVDGNTALAKIAGCTSAGMTGRVDFMVEAGLVERRELPGDRRRRPLVVTEYGTKELARIAPFFDVVDEGCA